MFSKKNIKMYFITAVFLIYIFSSGARLLATDASDDANVNVSYSDITKSLEYIRQNTNYINSRINEMKSADVYSSYPAIRLNVETPVFGITSIVNKKMTIRNDVSTSDIISGYSIYDIIRTNKIKVPSLSVGSVVVSTREIELSENMTMSDVNSSMKVLLNSMKQSKEVKEFVDDYISKNFYEYISDDTKTRVKDINDKCSTLEKNLKENEDKLIVIKFTNSEKYNEYIKTYEDIYGKIYNIKQTSTNILISDSSLDTLESQLKDLEETADNLSLAIKDTYDTADINVENLASSVLNSSVSILNGIDRYLAQSSEAITVEEIKERNASNDFSGDIITEDIDKYTHVKYPVTSENSANVLEENIKIINQTIMNIADANKKSSEGYVSSQTDIDQLVKCYKNIVLEERNFYSLNYSTLVSNISDKTSGILEYTDEYISNDYLFSNFYEPDKLDSIRKKYDDDSYFSAIIVRDYMKGNISSTYNRYLNVSNLYNSLTRSGKIS